MRRGAFVIVLAYSALLAAPEARAVEVVLGWDAATRWNSNVLNSSENEEADFSIRNGPLMEVRQQQGDVTGRLRWSSFWEGFLDTNGADNFSHFVDLDGAWQINARNQLRLSNDLARTDSISSQLVVQNGSPSLTGQGVEAGTTSTLRNQANATFAHQLSSLMSLEASVDNSLFNFEDDDRSDAVSTRGSLQITRALNPLMIVGLGAAFTRQDFGDTSFSRGSGSDVIEVFGIWNYRITPTFVMSMSLGPALNRPDQIEPSRVVPEFPTIGAFLIDGASCPQGVVAVGCQPARALDPVTGAPVFNANGQPLFLNVDTAAVPLVEASFLTGAPQSDDTMTLFGAWSLVKQWERSSARFGIQRRTSASSGNGVSTDLTSASASFAWQPEQKWQLTWVAGWTLQTSASDFPLTQIVVEPSADPVFVGADRQIVADQDSAVFRADGVARSVGVRESGVSNSAFESTTYQLQFIARRQISRRLTARARVSLFRFETSGDLQSDRTTDSLRFELGLRWEFHPFRL